MERFVARLRGRVPAFVVVALAVAPLSPAAAHPLETFGFGSRAAAMGSAATASNESVAGAFYNPAGVAQARHLDVMGAFLAASEHFSVSDAAVDSEPSFFLGFGLAAPLPLGRTLKDRLFVGIALTVPTSGLFDVALPDDEAITTPFWGARNRRMVFQGEFAGRITDWLSIGVGLSLLADVNGTVAVDLLTSRGQNSARIDIGYSLAANAGILAKPLPWLAIGLTWRGAHHMTIDLPVAVEVLSGVPPVSARIIAAAYDMPHTVSFGVAVTPLVALQLTADVTYSAYRSFRYASPEVRVYGSDGGTVQEHPVASTDFMDTVAPRVGVEWWALPWLAVRGGYGFIPSPIAAQRGATNLLDGDRHTVSLGVGFRVPGALLWEGSGDLHVDLHGQGAVLHRREFEKHMLLPDNPGYPNVSFSGGAWSAGLSVRMSL